MRDTELLDALTPSAAIASTLWGLAHGYEHGTLDRAGIACVIANRLKAKRPAWGTTLKSVALTREPFACWAPDDHRYGSTMDAARNFGRGEFAGKVGRECGELARLAVLGTLEDISDGATHFCDRRSFESDAPPGWAVGKSPCFDTGNFVFFRL